MVPPGARFLLRSRHKPSEQAECTNEYLSIASAGFNEELRKKMVPGAGVEPARGCPRGILSPLCLPISPPGLYTGAFAAIRRCTTVLSAFTH